MSVYRCADCGNGEHLTAWAHAVVFGPLGADGELSQYTGIEDDWVAEDSIQCTRHPGGAIEKCIGGQWHRWWACPKCGGRGRVLIGVNWRAPGGYECTATGTLRSAGMHAGNGHEGWRLAAGEERADPPAEVSRQA